MKKIVVCCLLLLPGLLVAQNHPDAKRSRYWVLGYGNYSDSEIYHTFLDFSGDTLRVDSLIVPGSLYMSYTNASICDTAGNLLFFSNGCGVMDSSFEYVPGAEHINDSPYQNYLCSEIGGGRRLDALLILPEFEKRFFDLVHLLPVNLPGIGITVDRLLWSRISLDTSGVLATVWKDSTIVLDTLYSGGLASCRHADGKSWWVVAPVNASNQYQIVKISEGTVQAHLDTVGIATDQFENSTGEAVFSPDGTKYARYTIHADLQIFDFDRCTGQFSNPIHVPIVDAADTTYAAGAAFSPSGRYLYVSSTNYIYQFDLMAADIPGSKTTVATYDGFFYPIPQLPTRFYQCELAPDGKIYVSCPGGKYTFHVIEHPDSAGVACQVVQHKYLLDYPIIGGLPHFPNFNLGLTATPCVEGQAPVAGFEWQVADTLLPLQVQFADQSQYSPQSWHWDFGDGAVSQDSSPVHTYAAEGVYEVCLVVQNVWGADTTCQSVVVMTSSSGEAVAAGWGRVWVFPNPASTVLYVTTNFPGQVYRVHNTLGTLVMGGVLKDLANSLDISGLSSGVYFLVVEGATRTTLRFVVAH